MLIHEYILMKKEEKMRKLLIIATVFAIGLNLYAQGPRGKDFGFGIMLGEPTGLTGKFWTNNENAFAISLGSSYFGGLRITGDYLWHLNVFNSSIIKLYTGPGVALGFGDGNDWIYEKDKGNDKFFYRDDDDFGLAARGVFGLNIIPRRTPLEIFVEVGVLVGLMPNFGTAGEAAIGIRFYP